MGFAPRADRVRFAAELAAAWARLARLPAAERRIALVLANYPTRDGRLANGVGLDTPASTIAPAAARCRARAIAIEDLPADGQSLVEALLAGVTNALRARAAT